MRTLAMRSKKPKVIIVEGVDCVGKTTLAKALATDLGMLYLYTPQSPLASIRKEIETLQDPNTRFFYYLCSVIAVQRTIRENLQADRGIIIDRYIYSTIVMHQMLGVDVSCINVAQLPIVQPDFSILLIADADVRVKRRAGRDGFTDYDKQIEQSTSLLERAQAAYQNACEWSAVIDTNKRSSEDVQSTVLQLLRERVYV